MNSQQKWVAFYTIVYKEVRRFLRIWPQTLLPPAITMTLYFVIFGTLIGSRIGQMGGFSYMQFVVPGLIMMAVVTNAYANVVSSFFGAKFQHSIEELLVSPVPNYVILIGFVAGGRGERLVCGSCCDLAVAVFSDLSIHNPFITVAVVVMTAILFALAGFINAVYANNFDDISIIPTFVLTPLIYLGGVFYSMDLLSDFWVGVSRINPMLYVINAFRYGVLGVSDVNVLWSFTMVAVFTVVAFMYSLHLLNTGKRLRQ